MTTISSNWQAIRTQIFQLAQKYQRDPAEITLLAVSKTFSAELVEEAFAAGQSHFGENYVQEALDKQACLDHLPITWHFIGPIQSNKTRLIAEHFTWVHSIDRIKIAQRLSAQRPAHLPPQQICIQVNISRELSKSGVLPEELPTLIAAVSELPNLQIRGLMAVPAPSDNPAEQRSAFQALANLLTELNQQNYGLDTLSMGMSHDFAEAIAAGSTMIRVGSAIFGQRNLANKQGA